MFAGPYHKILDFSTPLRITLFTKYSSEKVKIAGFRSENSLKTKFDWRQFSALIIHFVFHEFIK